MSSITDFNRLECELIPGSYVNAYVEPKLNPLNLSELIIDSSWGEEKLDLTPAVQNAETTTHLKLSPENTPVYLEYDNEDGEHECIHGDNLAKIISLMKLKDVDDTDAPANGDTIMFNGDTNKFETYPLAQNISRIDGDIYSANANITALQASVASIQNAITQIVARLDDLEGRVTEIESRLTPPTGVPTDQVVFGDINLYSDSTNSGSKAHGFFSHNPANDITNDERFA